MTVLSDAAAQRILDRINTCTNCGKPSQHWVTGILGSSIARGFWICPHMYDETGRRKPEFIDPIAAGGLGGFFKAFSEAGLFGDQSK